MKLRHTRNIGLSLSLLLCCLFSLSCKSEEKQAIGIDLPPTAVLAKRTRYALIVSSHLRLRTKPEVGAPVKETLWKGAVLEVVSKASQRMVVENQENYWYQVRYDGLQGYVFGAYLNFFTSREAAEDAARMGS